MSILNLELSSSLSVFAENKAAFIKVFGKLGRNACNASGGSVAIH